jgi:hypothetical protein
VAVALFSHVRFGHVAQRDRVLGEHQREEAVDHLASEEAGVTKLLRRAEKQHGEAAAAFERVAGDTMFGAASP